MKWQTFKTRILMLLSGCLLTQAATPRHRVYLNPLMAECPEIHLLGGGGAARSRSHMERLLYGFRQPGSFPDLKRSVGTDNRTEAAGKGNGDKNVTERDSVFQKRLSMPNSHENFQKRPLKRDSLPGIALQKALLEAGGLTLSPPRSPFETAGTVCLKMVFTLLREMESPEQKSSQSVRNQQHSLKHKLEYLTEEQLANLMRKVCERTGAENDARLAEAVSSSRPNRLNEVEEGGHNGHAEYEDEENYMAFALLARALEVTQCQAPNGNCGDYHELLQDVKELQDVLGWDFDVAKRTSLVHPDVLDEQLDFVRSVHNIDPELLQHVQQLTGVRGHRLVDVDTEFPLDMLKSENREKRLARLPYEESKNFGKRSTRLPFRKASRTFSERPTKSESFEKLTPFGKLTSFKKIAPSAKMSRSIRNIMKSSKGESEERLPKRTTFEKVQDEDKPEERLGRVHHAQNSLTGFVQSLISNYENERDYGNSMHDSLTNSNQSGEKNQSFVPQHNSQAGYEISEHSAPGDSKNVNESIKRQSEKSETASTGDMEQLDKEGNRKSQRSLTTSSARPSWLCNVTTRWRDLGLHVFPRYIQETDCVKGQNSTPSTVPLSSPPASCYDGHFFCRTTTTAVQVLVRHPGNCNDSRVPVIIRDHYFLSVVNIPTGCQCRP